MRFSVRFYFDRDGRVPLSEFLADLRTRQPRLEKLVVAGLRKLEDSMTHGPPLTQMVDPRHDIYELRVGRADIARAFFFFRAGQTIVVTNGYVKKGQDLDRDELDRACRYKADWEARNP